MSAGKGGQPEVEELEGTKLDSSSGSSSHLAQDEVGSSEGHADNRQVEQAEGADEETGSNSGNEADSESRNSDSTSDDEDHKNSNKKSHRKPRSKLRSCLPPQAYAGGTIPMAPERQYQRDPHAADHANDSEGFSDESEVAPFDDTTCNLSSANSAEDIRETSGSPTTDSLETDLQQSIQKHQRELQDTLNRFVQDGLYSQPDVARQLTSSALTARDDCFGHRVLVGHFLIPEANGQETTFQESYTDKSKLREHMKTLRNPSQESKALFWVHLPVNNLRWVEEVMTVLLDHTYGDEYLSKKAVRRCLRRERNAVQRALGSDIPTTMQTPHGRCRKIRVSDKSNAVKVDILTCMMPYLHWERSVARMQSSRILQHAQQAMTEVLKKHGRQKLNFSEVSKLPCPDFEKMIRYYSVGRPLLPMRQTLDRFYYQDLESTESRDRDQVVEKYSRKEKWQKRHVLMVDQLWLWVLDNDTVLTCFPNSFPYKPLNDKDKPNDILPSLQKYLMDSDHIKRNWVRTAYHLAYCITDRCASNVFDRQLYLDERFDFLGMFQHSITNVMEQQSSLYKKVSRDLRDKSSKRKFNAAEEFTLLEEAKDILDELRIMWDINSTQAALLNVLSGLSPQSVAGKRQAYFLKERPSERADIMKEMMEKAESTHEAIIHLIDLKQTQGNLFQATQIRKLSTSNNKLLKSNKKIIKSTNKTLKQSKESGETLMVFTVVTILFLPLSTLASFFSLNARELNDGHLTIGVIFACILPLSAFIIFVSLLFGFSSGARRSLLLRVRNTPQEDSASPSEDSASEDHDTSD